MKYSGIPLFVLYAITLSIACNDIGQNTDDSGKDILKSHEMKSSQINNPFIDTVYVPIYSEIYSQTKDITFKLTATLSIRNTSMADTIYITHIDYYNSAGELVRQYLSNSISLKPLETIDYVIEEKDKTGGTGANFIIIWNARKQNLNPIFQGVMISTDGQQGISYITEGVSVRNKQ